MTQSRSMVTVPVVGAAVAVLDRVVEAGRVVAARLAVGDEGDRARVERDGAARRVAHVGHGRRAVGVGVVGQEVGVSDRDVGVLGARGIVVARDRVVVDARDVDGDVAGVGARAVGQLVVEAALVVAAQVRGQG